MSEPAKKIDPRRLAALLDAGTVGVGIVSTSVGVGLYDWRAGVVAFGALLLGAEVVAALLRR
jgi:hypothetical protein